MYVFFLNLKNTKIPKLHNFGYLTTTPLTEVDRSITLKTNES